jgi:hypothetical protein
MISKLTTVCFLSLALVAAAAEKAKVPSEKELKALTLDSLLAFNKAVAAKDFTSFHGQISKLWQGQITPSQLAETFKTFIDQEIDIAFLSSADPVFDKPPAIDGDGVLILDGHYPTSPNKVTFRLKYLYEKTAWKLIGINLNVVPAGTKDVALPSEKEIRALVLDSLGNFNQAVQKKSFADFYGQISALWQKQTTPAKLQKLFQSFIDQEIDLAPMLKGAPAFEEPPAINEDGILKVKGSFPPNERLRFDLAYIFEPPAWKLVKVNVKVRAAGEEEKDE